MCKDRFQTFTGRHIPDPYQPVVAIGVNCHFGFVCMDCQHMMSEKKKGETTHGNMQQKQYSRTYLAETTHVPSRLNDTAVTGSECAGNVLTHCPLRTSQSLTVSSKEPLANKLDDGLNWQQKTKLSCPRNSTSESDVCASKIRNVLSSDAVAQYGSVAPLFDQQTSLMPREWPMSVAIGDNKNGYPPFVPRTPICVKGSPKSQIFTVPSADDDAHNAAWFFVSLDGANRTADTARLCSPYIGKHTNCEPSASVAVPLIPSIFMRSLLLLLVSTSCDDVLSRFIDMVVEQRGAS